MNVRHIAESDLPEIFSWFQARKWPTPPVAEIAPDVGFVAEEDGKMLACAWVYLTGRSIAFIDWLGTNPEASESKGSQAVQVLIEEMKGILSKAVTPPIKALSYSTPNEKLADTFVRMKFRNQSQMHRLLWTSRD